MALRLVAVLTGGAVPLPAESAADEAAGGGGVSLVFGPKHMESTIFKGQ